MGTVTGWTAEVADKAASASLRLRVTAAAVAIVAVALMGASIALVMITRSSLENNLRSSARLRAQDFVALLESGTLPSELHIRLEEDVVVQIIDESGEVVASSPFLDPGTPIVRLGDGESRTIEGLPDEEGDPFLVVARSAETQGEVLLVLVGRNLDSLLETTRTVTLVLFVSVPILLLVVGTLAWLMVGRMLDRLDAAHARQRRFISDASHELRNPIAAIRQHAEIALEHPDRASVHALAGEVLNEDLRLQRVAEDLLLLARADEGMLEPKLRPLDLDDLVLQEAARLKRTTELRIDTTGVTAARTTGDPVQLQRAVANLVDNAAGYAATTVRLAVAESGGRVFLQVDDDGPGIAEEERVRVFERFARLEEARDRKRGGAGLGLAIASEIVATHGGRIDVGDAPLGGARFELILPAT